MAFQAPLQRVHVKRIFLGIAACTLVASLIVVLLAQAEFSPPENFPVLDPAEVMSAPITPNDDQPQTATFGSGCFWCTEAVFKQVKGVRTVVSGYSGGTVANPILRRSLHGPHRSRRGDPVDVRPKSRLVRGNP